VKYHAGKSNSAALLECEICDAKLACASALSKEVFDPERQLADAHAGCMINRVGEGRRGAGQADLAHAARAERVAAQFKSEGS
jgi:hypothetical protein